MQELLRNKLSFIKQPIPLPAEYRPMYKIGLIVIILKICCRGESGNLLKLHLFSWALASEKNMSELQSHIDSDFTTKFSIWGIEPALNRALQLAVAENICDLIDGKNYRLTEKGNIFFEMIDTDSDLFAIEKAFLGRIGKSRITDARINSMTKHWNLPHVKN